MSIGTNLSSTGYPLYASVSEAKSIDLQVGATAQTVSYYGGWAALSTEPVGGSLYNVVTPTQYTAITGNALASGHADHIMSNGNILMLDIGLVANVRSFGATGNGSTDDRPPVQSALDAHDTVFFPKGTYRINSSLTMTTGNRHIYGENKETTILSSHITDATSGLVVGSGALMNNVYIHDMSVHGNDIATGAAIEFIDLDVCTVERVDIEDFSQSATTSRGLWFKGRDFLAVKNVRCKDVVTGILFDDNPNAPTLDADHCLVDEYFFNGSDTEKGIGIDFIGSDNINIKISNYSAAAAFHGIRINNTTTTDSDHFIVENMRTEQGHANQPNELPAHARGVLELTGQPLDTETVTLGTKTYTYQTTLTNVDGNVLIGASASASIDNLIAAINLAAGSGSTYAAATTAQPESITAIVGNGDTLNVGNGTDGTQTTTETLTNGNWNAATLRTQANTGYTIYMNQSAGSSIKNVTLTNVKTGNYNNGFFLRNINNLIINNCNVAGGNAHNSINADTTVKAMSIRNFDRPPAGLQRTTGLAHISMTDANGGLEIWGDASSPPKISATDKVGFNQPWFTPGGAATATAGLTEQLEWGNTQVVADTALMAATVPTAIQGFGIIQAADTTGGNRASAVFSWDDTVTNADVVILAQNNATNTSGTATSLNIFGSGNTLRFENNLGAQTKISVKLWYSSSALS